MKAVRKIKAPLPVNSLIKKAQEQFNKFIRIRDKESGCVSCKSPKIENASHYYNAGQYTALRFNEDNVHGACIQCNHHKHGNLLPYRMTLVKRIGEQRLNLLESTATRSRVKKWSRTELEIIYQEYKAKNK